MIDSFNQQIIPAKLTQEEWTLILRALKAYEHNTRYRELMEKLAYQFSSRRIAA